MNHCLDEARSLLYFLGRYLIGDADRHEAAPLLHATDVPQSNPPQVGVGHDDLLATHAADARTLDSDMLNLNRAVVDDQVVAYRERLVERDRQRGEEVSPRIVWTARAIAMPPMPRPAMKLMTASQLTNPVSYSLRRGR